MKKYYFNIICLLLFLSCGCNTSPTEPNDHHRNIVKTRAYGDKSPKIMVSIETNDVNPLNAGDYELSDGKAFVDIVMLFASNLQKRTIDGVIQPVLKLNDRMVRILEPDPTAPTTTGYHKYVKPLQEKGIKVLLTVLGNWDGISVASMNDTQTTQFAQILAYVVDRYDLDGIDFDDEYSGTSVSVPGSYGSLISKLKNLMPADKLITVLQCGSYGPSQISSTQGALIDYASPCVIGDCNFIETSSISGVTNSHWCPICIYLGSTNNTGCIYENARTAAEGQYGGMMTANLRRSSDVDPLPVFNALAGGAYEDEVSVVSTPDNASDRPQDWEVISEELYFTMDDVDFN